MEVSRAKSGVSGLDELIEGGFPRGRSILISGGPGSGKTTTSIQFLVNGATQYGEKGIYVGLENPHSYIVQDMSRFGFDLPRLESENRVVSIAPATSNEVNMSYTSPFCMRYFTKESLLINHLLYSIIRNAV